MDDLNVFDFLHIRQPMGYKNRDIAQMSGNFL